MQSVEMKPMFLPDVQNNPQPSPYFELIRSAQNFGQEYWQIWHLFAPWRIWQEPPSMNYSSRHKKSSACSECP